MSFISDTLYHLKREYSKTLIFRRKVIGNINLKTGIQTQQNYDYEVEGIFLPDRIYKTLVASAIPKVKISGGELLNTRKLILEKFEIDPEESDEVIFQEYTYKIVEILIMDDDAGFLLSIQGDKQ